MPNKLQAVCGFLGHRGPGVFDGDLYPRLLKALSPIVQDAEKTVFLFHQDRDAFMKLCLEAGTELRDREPEKVSIRTVRDGDGRLDQPLLERMTHLVAYLYPAFHDEGERLRARAQKLGLVILDLCSPETASEIARLRRALPERERFILDRREAGCTLKEVADILGVTPEAVRQSQARACYKLRRALRQEPVKSKQAL